MTRAAALPAVAGENSCISLWQATFLEAVRSPAKRVAQSGILAWILPPPASAQGNILPPIA
jgi:hypothetical protein